MISHFLEPNRPIVTFYMRGETGDTLEEPGHASRRADDRQAALRADQRPTAPAPPRNSSAMSPASSSASWSARPAAGAGYRNEFFPVPGGYRDQRLGRPRGARIDRQGLGEGRHRADHRKPSRPRRSKSPRCTRCASLAAAPTRHDKEVLEGSCPGPRGAGHVRSRPRFRCQQYAGVYGVRHDHARHRTSSFSSVRAARRPSWWRSAPTSSPSSGRSRCSG